MKQWLRDVKDTARHAKEQIKEETSQVQSRRQKLKLAAGIIGRGLQQAADDAHDQVLLAKHRSMDLTNVDQQGGESGAQIPLFVDIMAACDLRCPPLGEPDPYCLLAVGLRNQPWSVKVRWGTQAKVPVQLRQRHPRWGASCTLQIPCGLFIANSASIKATNDPLPEVEVTVRVMDTRASCADTVLGEARILLAQQPEGARSMRLLAGGFASMSLRWSLRGEPFTLPHPQLLAWEEAGRWHDVITRWPFEGSLLFWTSYATARASGAGSTADVQNIGRLLAAACELQRTSCTDGGYACAASSSANLADQNAGVDEVFFQAPLACLFAESLDVVTLVLETLLQRMSALTPTVRSRVVGALVEKLNARGGTDDSGVHDMMRCVLHTCFVTIAGNDVAELKRLTDTAGTGHGLIAVYTALSQPKLQASLVEHFRTEGRLLPDKVPHVLSDIDMTIWVGAFGVGGPKFPKGPIPGAVSLFETLGGRITFLSARPPIWEAKTRGALLDNIGIAEATVLQGTLQNLLRYIVNREEACKGMGEQKEKAFNEFALLHPEARFIFFGDSGEGDIGFATAFVEDFASDDYRHGGGSERREARRRPDRVALIHDVVGPDGITPKTSRQEREALMFRGVFVFDTYIGAAYQLYLLGLLDEFDLCRAAQRCIDEFSEMSIGDFHSAEVYATRKTELQNDMRLANLALSGSLEESHELKGQ
eukprot:TRINITY_DN70657_c0_g1_i1.p1 TRINITY_DN70657_c0_g1~~TRINITY_DN70657_c0_g1_i1.p1  ORF type:complete len:707 (-),score=124.40 TRINITY_DN70657_c0_g1_i1:41-2161(-)